MKKIDLYLISGFLGSGKTTFLQRLLTDFSNKKIGVIMNEFGSIGIDGKLVERNDIKLIEINGGSIFCSCLKGGFVKTLLAFLEEDIDVLFIENSGMADPSNMHRLLGEIEERKERSYQYKGAVCIIDAVTFLKYVRVITPVQNQVITSNFILINKEDLVNQETLNQIKEKIKELNPTAYVYQTMYAQIPLQVIEENLFDNEYTGETSNQPYNRMMCYSMETTELITKENLEAFIQKMQPRTLRMKGFAKTNLAWIQVDVVGDSVSIQEASLTKWDVIEHTKLVIIGNGPEAFEEELTKAWKQTCKTELKVYE